MKTTIAVLITTAFVVTHVQAQSWLTNGLVAYYPFNGNANDATGNGRHGSMHGATPVEDHAFSPGAALRLNGTSDYIYFGPVLPDMQTFTITSWVKSYGGGTFFNDADWELANDFGIQLGAQDTFVRCDKPGFSTFVNIPLSTQIEGVWRHMAWVVTSGSIRVYVDGVLSGTTAVGGADVGYHHFIIGTQEFPQGSVGWLGYWRGDVSEMRIYNRALTDDQVAIISGRTTNEPRLDIRVSQVELCWQTSANTWYQLQYNSTLTTNQWLPLSTNWVTGDGTRFCTTDAIVAGTPQRFYQLSVTNSPPQ